MPTARELFGFVVLLTDVDPVVAKIAVIEFSSGVTPADISAVHLEAFVEASERCVSLCGAAPGTPWGFAGERLKQLQAGHAAAAEIEEVRRAIAAVEQGQSVVRSAASQMGIDQPLREQLIDASVAALRATQERQSALLDRLRVGSTRDLQTWDTIAFMMGRALRGEFRSGHAHAELTRTLVSGMLTRYLGAGASPENVWTDSWEKQKELLEI